MVQDFIRKNGSIFREILHFVVSKDSGILMVIISCFHSREGTLDMEDESNLLLTLRWTDQGFYIS